jgi:hypothetical protein
MCTYPITEKAKDAEMNNFKNILYNNDYDINLLNKLSRPQHKRKQNTHNDTQQQKTKWATFTYNSKEIRAITNLFRDTEVKIAFRTRYTIQNILKPQPKIDKYNKSGIYQLKCLDCPLKYVGQTGRTFKTRYKEHIHDRIFKPYIKHWTHIRNNNRYHGSYNGEEGKTFKHMRKVSYLQC